MDSILSQNGPNSVGIVQHYLTTTESSHEYLEERSRVVQICEECLFLLQTSLKKFCASRLPLSEDQKSTKISLQRSFGRLKLWSDEHSIPEGALDDVLAESSSLEHKVLKILTNIGETLTERLINFLDISVDTASQESIENIRRLSADAVDSVSDGSSESGRSAFSCDSLKEALEDLQMDTTCLLDLESLLSDPIVLAEPEPVRPDNCQTWQPTQSYCDKISARFPKADERLIQRLANANYCRYLRCQETRNCIQSAEVLSNDVIKDNHDGASSKFHDSGIGSSLATTYADTVMSYGDNDVRKVRLPPLPAHAKDGVPFLCLCCGKLVSVRTNSAWKQHIYADLQPWICIDTECPIACETFQTQKDWVSHLALDHGLDSDWMSIKCPLCRHDTGSGKALVTKHLGSHLEEISLGALPVDCEFEEDTTQSELEILSTVSESREPEFGPSSSHGLSSGQADLTEKWKAETSRITTVHEKFEKIIEQMEVQGRSSKEILQALKFTVRNSGLDKESLGPLMRSYFDDVVDDLSLVNPVKECSSDASWPISTEANRTSPCTSLPREARTTETEGPAEEDGSLHSRNGRPENELLSAPAYATLGTFRLNFEPLPSIDIPGAIQSGTDNDEHNEPRYCYCNRASFGEMVGCDGEDCNRQWFHLGCVGLKSAPSAHVKWFCDECKATNSSALLREQFATQSPAVQQKTIAMYAQNLQQQQQQQQIPKPGMPNANPSSPPGQKSPIVAQGPNDSNTNTFYNAEEIANPNTIKPANIPNADQTASKKGYTFQDYDMQLMLLERQNKLRLMMARQELDQVKALCGDTSQKEDFLGDKHIRSSDKLDHEVPEEIELATSRSDMTTERRDSLIASERTVVSTADLASDDITDKQEGGRNMSLIDEANYEDSQVETARETRPMIGDPKERDEDLALQNYPATGLLGVPGQKARSDLPHLRSRGAKTTKPKVKTGCFNCKQRRIKCDEKRPACSNCVRSKKICNGYPPPPRSARPPAQAAPNAGE